MARPTPLPTADLLALFQRHLPLRVGRRALSFAHGREPAVWRDDDDGRLRVALALTSYDQPGDSSPSNVHEQEVCFTEAQPLERWQAYLEGNLRALPAILAGRDDALPAGLFAYDALLADAALQRAEDFAAALGDPLRLAAMDRELLDAEWREQLAPIGLADHVDQVRALARPALRLHLDREPGPDEDEDDDEDEDKGNETWSIGDTRLGGDPDLPPAVPWPELAGEPLTFVAQFALAGLAGHPAARELPAHGLLSFFYLPCPPDGVRDYPVRVLHTTHTAGLARRPAPPGSQPLAAYAIEVADERCYPAIESQSCYEALLPEARVLAARQARKEGQGEELLRLDALAWFIVGAQELDDDKRPFHRLLGHPAAIQGDPYLDVEIGTQPGGWDGWEDGSAESLRIERQAQRWRLLLQIDAHERDGLLLNQDGGFFYFWIPAEALVVHDWTQVRGALQCH